MNVFWLYCEAVADVVAIVAVVVAVANVVAIVAVVYIAHGTYVIDFIAVTYEYYSWYSQLQL